MLNVESPLKIDIMKRNRLFLIAAMLPVLSVMQAQTSYEAAELFGTDLNGTARFVGMGGAMSALGADISTVATNPAGIALYRSWDMSMSASANGVTHRAESNSGRSRLSTSYGSFDNLGIVIANKVSNENVIRFCNFAVNYRNVKRFDGKMGVKSNLNGLSQTCQMAWQAWENWEYVDYTYFDPDSRHNLYDINYFGDPNYGWLTLMGGYADLMGLYAVEDENGKILRDDYGNVIEDYWYRLADGNDYTERVSGGINAYDFNLSLNLVDAAYFGVTLTTYSVDRRFESTYTEYFSDGYYTLQDFYRTTGTGYDLKFGAILRPFEESSFRIGVSATTPAVYKLRDYNSAIINSSFDYGGNFTLDTQDNDAFGGDCYTDYTVITPAKINASLGGTIGTSLALGAEYEYTNYGATKLLDNYGYENKVMNDHTTQNFTGNHTLRLGMEKMFAGSFYTRLGYNYITGGYKHDAWKMIPINSVQTNTAYRNILSTTNLTCGLGYRGDAFYADAALLYSHQSAHFFPFDDFELPLDVRAILT